MSWPPAAQPLRRAAAFPGSRRSPPTGRRPLTVRDPRVCRGGPPDAALPQEEPVHRARFFL